MIDLVAERTPLGGLERWLTDPSVTEVMVNAGSQIWVEQGGRMSHVGTMRVGTLLATIEHVLAPIGRRIDRAQPMVDARLADGSRVCAVLPPVAVDGPCLAIRRFSPLRLGLDAFTVPAVADVLVQIVRQRCNVLVSGATSSGKTTLLGALAAHIDPQSRVITLEDVAELRLEHPHVVRLETRPATPDGVGEVGLVELVRTALRLRPDRLVVGEVRGAEAVPLLQALHTGHDGSLATVHANSAADALERIAALVVQSVGNWPAEAVRRHVERAIDVVVHLQRTATGARTVQQVAEVGVGNGTAFRVTTLATSSTVVAETSRGRAWAR